MKKRVFLFFLCFTIYAAIGKKCFDTVGSFAEFEIRSNHPYEPLFETRPLTDQEKEVIAEALSQTYRYETCGGQAFVFFSDDGKYVIKFFKQRHFRQPSYLHFLPVSQAYKERKFTAYRTRMEKEFSSYKIAFEELAPQTGMLYTHINPTSHLNQKLTVIDKLHIKRQIDLDSTVFILQKKADLVTTTLKKKMAQGDVKGAQDTIDSVIDLILWRCKAGYRDKDHSIWKNCGILDGKAIKIDVGRFSHQELVKNPLVYKTELFYIARKFKKWLLKNEPALATYLDEKVQHVIFHE